MTGDQLFDPAEPLELEAARRLFGFDRHCCHYAERRPGAPLACRCGAELTRTPPRKDTPT